MSPLQKISFQIIGLRRASSELMNRQPRAEEQQEEEEEDGGVSIQ